jgi:hypothetical protein
MNDSNDKETTAVSGVASSDMLDELRQQLKEQEELSSKLLQRCFNAESDLRGTKASVVHELELAGVTRTYDDEEIHCGNYLQGIRILRDRANSSNEKD